MTARYLPSRSCNVHGFRARGFLQGLRKRMSAATLLAKDAAARRASAETRRCAVAVGEQLLAKSASRSDESAWLKAKRLLLAAASGQMVDKGDAAAARRLSHNETIRPRSAVKKDAQWVLSAAEMDTVRRIASIPAATRAPEETTELLHVLRSCSLFLSLDENTAMAMAGALSWQEYEQDELVFAEDQVGDSFYLIVVGSVAVLMRDREVKDSTVVSAAELYAGDAFGEASFLDLKQRSVSVCALDRTVALRVQRDDYLCSLRTWHSAQLRRKLALLSSAPLLAVEARRLLRPWAERLVEESACRGQRVIEQGQLATRMYLVVAGELAVLREVQTSPGDATSRQTMQVATLRPRDIFGEYGAPLGYTDCAHALLEWPRALLG